MTVPPALVSEQQASPALPTVQLVPFGENGRRAKVTEPHLSPSQIKMLLRCPAQYMFAYLDREPRAGSHKLIRGSAVHEGAETYLLRKKNTPWWSDRDHAEAIEASVASARDYIARTYDASMVPIKISAKAEVKATKTKPAVPAQPERAMTLGELVDSTVNGTRFMAEASWRQIDPVAIEQGYLIRWDDGTLPILCYADVIEISDEDDGREPSQYATVHDLKTGATKSQIELDRDIAITAYCLGHEATTGIPTRRATYQSLVYNQELKFDEKRTTRDAISFRRLHTVASLAQKVMKNGLFPPCDDGQTCSWCDFSTRCLTEF